MNEELIEIGYTQRPHGVKGEIKVTIEDEFFEDLENLEVLFLNIRGTQLPYFVEAIRGSESNIVKFEDINDKEAAKKIASATIYARKKDLEWETEVVIEEEQELLYSHCTGFEMIDIHDGHLGTIKEMLEYPQQELAIIEVKGKEVLLPLNEYTVQQLDNEQKKITVEMPEGLLDLGNS